MNKIILIGNLTADAESSTTNNGVQCTKFCLAVRKNYGEGTDFINCISWRKTAEISANLKKGSKVAINGCLDISEVEKDGTKTKYYKVIFDNIEFLSKKEEPAQGGQKSLILEDSDGDLPF